VPGAYSIQNSQRCFLPTNSTDYFISTVTFFTDRNYPVRYVYKLWATAYLYRNHPMQSMCRWVCDASVVKY
jgi:hypothetical protein